MSTAAAPALETGGGSSTSGSAVTDTASDPVDAFDLSTLDDTATGVESETHLPDSMLLGGKRPVEGEETGEDARDDRRNPNGTFAKKGEKEAKEAADAAKTDAPTGPTTPFKYRAMGQTHDLEGATINAAGDVTIPAAKAPWLREAANALHLAQGHFTPVLERKERENTDLKARLADMETSRTANDAKAEQLVGLLSGVMTEPNDEKALQQLWALRSQWGTLVSKAEAEHYRGELERMKKAPASNPNSPPNTPETERAASPRDGSYAESAKAVTRDFVEELKVQHEYRDISPEIWKQVDAQIERTPMAYLRPATAVDAQKYGVQVGETVFDRDLVIERVTAERTKAHQARETTADAARLAATNARLTQPSVDAPPSPSGGGKAPAKRRGQGFTNQQDVQDWWDSDQL